MSKVSYNQSGYVGQSMSVRAREAYADGEMPKSKWTKKAMLSAIADYCDEFCLSFDESAVSKMSKADVFSKFFTVKSWHHTGKFANETDFYGLDEEEVVSTFAPMSDDDCEKLREAKREAAYAEFEKRAAVRARLEAEQEEERRFAIAHGYEKYSPEHYAAAHPEMVIIRTSKRGNEVLSLTFPSGKTSDFVGESRTCSQLSRVYFG